MKSLCGIVSAVGAVLVMCGTALATETENLGIQVLPAPGKVAIDGKFDDWDLTGGVFACGDVENQRATFAVWIHAMYDAENLYILARFIDETPMNNPGQTIGDMGFNGDCLQARFITAAGAPQERVAHMTAWKGRDGPDLIDITYGTFGKPLEGNIKDAKTQGARQAFLANSDGKGYTQEIAIPWRLLTRDGRPPEPGGQFQMTVEPNFTVGTRGRLTIKDIFKAGVPVDRVFTFRSSQVWGAATLERQGKVAPRPLRLADARELPVRMDGGLPVVDWSALDKPRASESVATIRYTMLTDGYVSMIIRAPGGEVVRQPLAAEQVSKGRHEVGWDGLTMPIWKKPGDPVPPGKYKWEAIWHTGIGLRLRGWASNSGIAPWDGLTGREGWGGDHGVPSACAADGQRMYMGWNGSEAGRAVVAWDLADGRAKWRHTRGGMGAAGSLAVDGGTVYVLDGGKVLYRLDADTGAYSVWEATNAAEIEIKALWGADADAPAKADFVEARDGTVYLAFTAGNLILVLDGKSGKVLKKLAVPAPGDMEVRAGRLFVVSGGEKVLSVDAASGRAEAVISGLAAAWGIALDSGGNIYISVRDPDSQVKVFDPAGKPVREIGRKGGRATLGPWTPDGIAFAAGMAVDPQGRLWVMEGDHHPKRVSVWDTKTGALVMDFFGSAHYGAGGGTILPLDPNVMVGEGCEWRMDPATGLSKCTGTIERRFVGSVKFAILSNKKTYLLSGPDLHGRPLYRIYERVGEGDYKLRATIDGGIASKAPAKKGETPPPPPVTTFWADENGDGEVQPSETAAMPGASNATFYLGMSYGFGADLALYADNTVQGPIRVKVGGFTACGAPKYDLAGVEKIPVRGIPSDDGRVLLSPGGGSHYERFTAYSLPDGKVLWTYPNTFTGVHGSHAAPPPQTGLVRGILSIVGTATLPKPVGRIWAVATNVGEWHVLTEDGYYLSRLFEPDPLKVQWPAEARPGAVMDRAPPGAGAEDFGGAMIQDTDGHVYIQAGKAALWNLLAVGFENVKALGSGEVEITAEDARKAAAIRERLLQSATGAQTLTIRRATPKFTGDVARDFPGAQVLKYERQPAAAVLTAAAWDDEFLYLGWAVRDDTPWVNGADAAEFMYARGDTVDFQLGANPAADPKRREAGKGDFRLSIGPFKGKPAAVIYRKVSDEKSPKTFSSGVISEYKMDFVRVLEDARIQVKAAKDRYVVEAAVPLKALGLAPKPGLKLAGDFGVTHGDKSGADTMLRTWWNNQSTGIVSDEVFELKMEPANWGQITFQE